MLDNMLAYAEIDEILMKKQIDYIEKSDKIARLINISYYIKNKIGGMIVI